MAGDVPQAADPQSISLRGNGAGEGNKSLGLHGAFHPTAALDTVLNSRCPCPHGPDCVPPSPGFRWFGQQWARTGQRGPGAPVRRALLTLSTSPIGHSPFNLLSAFMFLSLVDEPAEAIHHPPTRVPNTQQSPLPTRGHTHAASTQVSQAVRAAGPSAVGPSSQRRSAPRMKAESVSRPRRHLIPI